MTVTKNCIADVIYRKVRCFRREATDLVGTVLQTMADTLENGEELKITGFGSFKLRHKNPRPGRNPQTGTDAVISARTVVTFKPSPVLKDKVNR
ncbi:integration host factor subunit alpha [Magnetococcales bacterium HHB-1]